MAKIIKNSAGKVFVSSNQAVGVDASIDTNIIPDNIKKGVEILGVTGTYEGSGGGSNEVTITWKSLADRYYFTKEDVDKIKEIPSIIRCFQSNDIVVYMLAYTYNSRNNLCYYRFGNNSSALTYDLSNDTFVFLGQTYTYDSSTERYISEVSDN